MFLERINWQAIFDRNIRFDIMEFYAWRSDCKWRWYNSIQVQRWKRNNIIIVSPLVNTDGLFCLHWQKRLFKVKLICNSMKLITFFESWLVNLLQRYYEDCPLRLIAIGRPMAGHMILSDWLNNIGGQVSFWIF